MADEAPIWPDLPICDPHHHLPDHAHYDRYLLPEYIADITASGHNIVSTVFVEWLTAYRPDGPEDMRFVGETEFANGIAALTADGHYGPRVCAGIVSRADLTGADVDAQLEEHIRAGGGRFRGVRHCAGWDEGPEIYCSHTNPPQNLYGREDFRAGFAKLAAYGLSFEAWQYHTQLPEVTALARAFPDTKIMLDHVGGPLGVGRFAGKRDTEVFTQWKRDLTELAACPNVWVKLGGLAIRLCGFGYNLRDEKPGSDELVTAWRPWIETALEIFGTERAMFESNYPVDKMTCSYGALWNTWKKIASGASETEKARLFHDNAVAFYRL